MSRNPRPPVFNATKRLRYANRLAVARIDMSEHIEAGDKAAQSDDAYQVAMRLHYGARLSRSSGDRA